MFVLEPSPELRQGDICFDWHVPKWTSTAQTVHDSDGTARRVLIDLHGKSGQPSMIALCSHDCELENPRNRRGIIVAPLFAWPEKDLGSEVSLDIISSSKPDGDGRWRRIQLFPVDLGDDLSWNVIDFSALTTMISPKSFVDKLLETKHYELDEDTRQNFKLKLAAFLARD